MARPNLVALTTLNIDTAVQLATTSFVEVTWPIPSATAVPSGHAYQIESFVCANKHASVAAKVTIVLVRSATDYEIVPLLTVPVGQTLNGIPDGKPYMLVEGDKLKIKANTASAIVCHFPHSDAS